MAQRAPCVESAVDMIQGKLPRLDREPPVPVARAVDAAHTILLIDAPEALSRLQPRPDRQGVVLTQMRMLSASMLSRIRPGAVVAPLITADYDIVDLGIRLQELGYRGDLYALTRPLPRAELVIREIAAICPYLNVRLLELA